jgi:hypothetical protein
VGLGTLSAGNRGVLSVQDICIYDPVDCRAGISPNKWYTEGVEDMIYKNSKVRMYMAYMTTHISLLGDRSGLNNASVVK